VRAETDDSDHVVTNGTEANRIAESGELPNFGFRDPHDALLAIRLFQLEPRAISASVDLGQP
jgi:hypothetical protein